MQHTGRIGGDQTAAKRSVGQTRAAAGDAQAGEPHCRALTSGITREFSLTFSSSGLPTGARQPLRSRDHAITRTISSTLLE